MAGVQQMGGPYETDASNIKIGGGSAARTEDRDYIEPEPHLLWTVDEFYKWSLYRAAIAEFIATLLFVYIGVSAAIGNGRTSPDGVGALGVAWSFGPTIFVLVYCTAGVSGGYTNPAVTLGLLLGRKLSVPHAFIYMIAQMAGGICGAGLVKGLQKTPFQVLGGATNTVSAEFSIGTRLAAEIIGTFFLVYVVYSATDAKRKARDSHVPVGARPIAHRACSPSGDHSITGCGINPARSFGPAALWSHQQAWDDQWIFWVGPFIGATLAAAYHQFVIRALPLGSHFLFPTMSMSGSMSISGRKRETKLSGGLGLPSAIADGDPSSNPSQKKLQLKASVSPRYCVLSRLIAPEKVLTAFASGRKRAFKRHSEGKLDAQGKIIY
ncbi:hypothetical protein AXG93_4699s1000 [Marchantia polymorpha subsp. ruderalis]|uniref:Aquaporin n=1 Tax=Marchantia polymorpha subsp. ruderalis TaxID=1480154 RepID=A0A176W473_MARPO|nr:hypothetical protein AXG93_4699s1000 [Marchantia polymorpha subsp. ruderalis]